MNLHHIAMTLLLMFRAIVNGYGKPCYHNELGKYYDVEIKNVSFVSRFYLSSESRWAPISDVK